MSSAIFGGLGSAATILGGGGAGSLQSGAAIQQQSQQMSGLSAWLPPGAHQVVSPHAQAQKAGEIIEIERERLKQVFLQQTPAHREAYISAQRVIAVHEALYPNTGSGLNHINSILSTAGGTHSWSQRPDVKLSLRDLEEAHANALLEDVLQGAE